MGNKENSPTSNLKEGISRPERQGESLCETIRLAVVVVRARLASRNATTSPKGYQPIPNAGRRSMT
jgi:hypothetical protein